jgi:hypothetical protein
MWNAGNFGNHAPDVTVSGANTALDSDGPNVIRLDAADNVWVGQPNGSILKFTADPSGNATPAQVIAGNPYQYVVTFDVLQSGGSGMSATVNMPAGIVAGQVLVVQFEFDANIHNFASPSGWTSVTPTGVGAFFYGGAGSYRVATGSETSSYTWVWDTYNDNWTARVITIAPNNTVVSGNIHGLNANSNNGGTTLTSLGTSGGGPTGEIGDFRLALFGTATVETITVNAGMTQIYSASSGTSSIAAGYEILTNNPVDRTATSSGSSNWGALNIIIHPGSNINPTGISFDSSGNVYVTDNNFDQGLEFDAAATGNATPLNTITNLAAGAWGNAQGSAVSPPLPSPDYYPTCILSDGTAGIPLEIQTPAKLLDEGRLGLCSRFFIDINTNGEDLALTILVDSTEYPYPLFINTPHRETVEVDYQVSGRIYSIRLVGCLSTGQVEFFEAWTDLDEGQPPQMGGPG